MAGEQRSWWGERFITALEAFTDPGRLGRGRSYARTGRILEYKIVGGTVTAQVKGSVDYYSGNYKAPIYQTIIKLASFSPTQWHQVLQQIGRRADMVTKLLLSEMPDQIEEIFTALNLHLLPSYKGEFTTACSCPDEANPCKHIAGLYYVLATVLDHDPLLMFELRGLSRQNLQTELASTPVGQILSAAMQEDKEIAIEPVSSYYTRPTTDPIAALPSHKEFWTGTTRLPPPPITSSENHLPALLIKVQGDNPPFWTRHESFIKAMEEIYNRVRSSHKFLH